MNLDRVARLIGSVSDRRSSTLAFSLTAAAVFGALDVAVNAAFQKANICDEWKRWLQTATIATAAGTVAAFVLSARGERRRIIRSDLELAAQLNHKLRNSLQLIVDADYVGEAEHKALIEETVKAMTTNLESLLFAMGVKSKESGKDR